MRPAERPIALIGPRACGKTTIGRLLARELGWPFRDLDEAIEELDGRSIAQIFSAETEEGFRSLELSRLRAELERAPAVLACGGGVVTTPAARALLRERALCVGLTAPCRVLAERIRRAGTSRPALRGSDPAAETRQLMIERLPLYLELAPVLWSTAAASAAEIGAAIAARLRPLERNVGDVFNQRG